MINSINENLLFKNQNGQFIDARGEINPIDIYDKPIDENGQILPTNSFGNFVYLNTNFNLQIKK